MPQHLPMDLQRQPAQRPELLVQPAHRRGHPVRRRTPRMPHGRPVPVLDPGRGCGRRIQEARLEEHQPPLRAREITEVLHLPGARPQQITRRAGRRGERHLPDLRHRLPVPLSLSEPSPVPSPPRKPPPAALGRF
ncbi:hypothetical protein [Streptomyces sp. NRRL S-1448]|uniref:hypothetical protein n=1 Tax=Streptomyces sp. NRRL S-1448 TaxID=1463883 RepID=UPI001F327233|nr:hypothetical protein [Streptomyces sp. NRRL S-1448]